MTAVGLISAKRPTHSWNQKVIENRDNLVRSSTQFEVDNISASHPRQESCGIRPIRTRCRELPPAAGFDMEPCQAGVRFRVRSILGGDLTRQTRTCRTLSTTQARPLDTRLAPLAATRDAACFAGSDCGEAHLECRVVKPRAVSRGAPYIHSQAAEPPEMEHTLRFLRGVSSAYPIPRLPADSQGSHMRANIKLVDFADMLVTQIREKNPAGTGRSR